MRILMVSHAFLPESMGGVENHIRQLARYLIEDGHQVGVFYRLHAPGKAEYCLIEGKWEGIQIFKVVHNFTKGMYTPFSYYDRKIEERFLHVVDQFQPDIVHIHHLGGLSTSLIGAAKRHGLPVLWTLHDFWPMCPLSHLLTVDGRICHGPDDGMRCVECLWLQSREHQASTSVKVRLQELGFWESLRRAPRFVRDFIVLRLMGGHNTLLDQYLVLPSRNYHMRHLLLQPDCLLSPSQFLIDKFVEWGIPERQFRHVQNGVAKILRQSRRAIDAPFHDPFTFGFVGTLYPYKGVDTLISAFEQAALPNTSLRIFGGAPSSAVFRDYYAGVEAQVARLENVTLEGRFVPEALPEILKQLDVLVLPSRLYENNPLVILEAFAMGIPVIAGNVGGMAELVRHDVNGLQFRLGDVTDLVDKLRMAIEPARLRRYRAAIHPPNTVEEVGETVRRIYEELLALG